MGNPRASVIVPCWNVARWVENAVESVRRGTFADFELIAVDDGSTDETGAILDRLAKGDDRIRVVHQANRGLSGARNSGLDVARGEYVFFLDPDDSFTPEFVANGVEEMERSGADVCIFPWYVKGEDEAEPKLDSLKGDYHFNDAESIRRNYLPRIIGYSMANVRDWLKGRPLWSDRELGSVCRCVYRRTVIARHRLRFDERIVLYEDAPFNWEYLLHANRMSCGSAPAYNYVLHAGGIVSNKNRATRVFRNKLTLLRKRQEVNRLAGGTLGEMYAASCVFSLLEMLALLRTVRIGYAEGRAIMREYAADDEVKAALRAFPLSWRKPHVALAVTALRIFGASALYTLAWMAFRPFKKGL